MTWTLGITLYLVASAAFCVFIGRLIRFGSGGDDGTYGAPEGNFPRSLSDD